MHDWPTTTTRSRVMAVLRTIAAAFGTMSAAVLVLGVAVTAIVAVLWVGAWLLLCTFTTIGS